MKLVKNISFPSLAVLAALCLSAVAPGIGQAQSATEKLTTAKEVLARYVEVTGGVENYKAIKAISQEATMSIELAGIDGKMEMKYSGPERLLVKVDMGAAGSESSGVFDDVGWSDSLITGTRLIEGKELEQLKSQTDMRSYYEPESVYKEMEISEEAEVDGKPCYVLRMTRKSDNVEYEYYSVETGLKVKSKITAETPMGAIPLETFYSDYKDFSGVKHPTKMTQKLPNGMEIVIKVSKFEANPQFAEGTFDLPENVKKLVDKQGK